MNYLSEDPDILYNLCNLNLKIIENKTETSFSQSLIVKCLYHSNKTRTRYYYDCLVHTENMETYYKFS